MIDGVASVLDVVDNIIVFGDVVFVDVVFVDVVFGDVVFGDVDVDVVFGDVVGVGVLIVFGVGDVGFELLRFSVLDIAAIIVAADVFFNLVFAFVDAVEFVVVFEL